MPPFPRPVTALRASKPLLCGSPCANITQPSLYHGIGSAISSRRAISSSPRRMAEHSDESHFEPPSGWLWGIPPGQKYEKEGWENIWYWGFYGSLGLAAAAYAFKPDTSIETWALEEAKRRLQAEGTLPEDDE